MSVAWNDKLRLVFSDVDETIADVYTPADPAIITELAKLLQDGIKLFMVTGGSLGRVQKDITDFIDPALRHDILVSHCSGAEVWGFTADGEVRARPFYSLYEERFTPAMKQAWRDVVARLVAEFGFRTHPVQTKIAFWQDVGRDPQDIMLDDRGPQITMEIVNGIDLTAEEVTRFKQEIPLTHGKHDLRVAVMQRAEELYGQAGLPVTPRLGGVFALDFALEGVSKTTSIQKVLVEDEVLQTIRLKMEDIQNPAELEIWGDKYSTLHGGTDRHMCEALPPSVRAIDFRQEDPAEFLPGYNIVIWDGQQHLHDGLLEYLQSRSS